MAASTVVRTAPVRTPRALAAAAAARTAPRGPGLAAVVPLPLRAVPSGERGVGVGSEIVAPRTPLTLVPSARPRRSAVARRGLAVLLVAALLAVGVGLFTGTGADASDRAIVGHVVLQPGETLWDVAVRSAPSGVDPRRQLETLRRINGFGAGPLDAWTVVLIPAA